MVPYPWDECRTVGLILAVIKGICEPFGQQKIVFDIKYTKTKLC